MKRNNRERFISFFCVDERKQLILTLKNDIEDVRLCGIICNYWKN